MSRRQSCWAKNSPNYRAGRDDAKQITNELWGHNGKNSTKKRSEISTIESILNGSLWHRTNFGLCAAILPKTVTSREGSKIKFSKPKCTLKWSAHQQSQRNIRSFCCSTSLQAARRPGVRFFVPLLDSVVWEMFYPFINLYEWDKWWTLFHIFRERYSARNEYNVRCFSRIKRFGHERKNRTKVKILYNHYEILQGTL